MRYLTRFAFKHAMNSAKSGNIKPALQSKTIHHALADELDALVTGHVAPRFERLVLLEARHRDGPAPALAVLDVAHLAGWLLSFRSTHHQRRS